MSSPREIRTKIKSVKNIAKITKAMELVSVSKMQKAVDQALRTREYALRAIELLSNISHDRVLQNPLLKEGKGEKTLVVLIGSNKGLCGGYNTNIAKTLEKVIEKYGTVDIIAIGRHAEVVARRFGLHIVASFVDIPEEVHTEHLEGVMNVVFEDFAKDEYKEVVSVYTTYINALSQKARARQILPITEAVARHVVHEVESVAERQGNTLELNEEASMLVYLFEPETDEVLNAILPRLVSELLYQMMLESRASEHSARMMAMKSATDNAKSLVDDLTLSYNKARQATVTREISEIAAGAEAL